MNSSIPLYAKNSEIHAINARCQLLLSRVVRDDITLQRMVDEYNKKWGIQEIGDKIERIYGSFGPANFSTELGKVKTATGRRVRPAQRRTSKKAIS